MNTASTVPILAPSAQLVANASQASVGAPLTPLQRLRILDSDQWEEFVLEWVDSLRQVYTDVHRCGGAGDLGRDVIGFKAGVNPLSSWDNYQCKHYAQPLAVSDVVSEVGKLLYHTSQGEFSLPDAYFFVAPQGPSTALIKVLQKGTLKQELLNRWNRECRSAIAKGQSIEIEKVQNVIDAFDFSRVSVLPPLRIIEGHQKTKYYTVRFGGGLPGRAMPIPKPPVMVQDNEHVYIKKLLEPMRMKRKRRFPQSWHCRQALQDLAGIWIDRESSSSQQNPCARLAGTTCRLERSRPSKRKYSTVCKKYTMMKRTPAGTSAWSKPYKKPATLQSLAIHSSVSCIQTIALASATN
jgi:hypothetical protein